MPNEALVVTIKNKNVIDTATKVKDLHTKVGETENQYSEAKEELVTQVKSIIDEETPTTHVFPRNFKAETEKGIVQVEAKVISGKGAMEVSVEKTLDTLFGPDADKLFEKTKTLDQVLDKKAILSAILKNPGVNLNDIEITIKNPGVLDLLEKETKGAMTTKEVILPKVSGFLETWSELPEATRKKAFGFIKEYLGKCMRLDVVCGNRGKK